MSALLVLIALDDLHLSALSGAFAVRKRHDNEKPPTNIIAGGKLTWSVSSQPITHRPSADLPAHTV
jgi:hypothetical protein